MRSINKKLFFNESLSGIAKSETFNFHLDAKVQFSVDKNEKGFFAKKIYIQVKIKSFKHFILSFIIYIRPLSCNKPVKYNSIFHREI